MVIAVTHGVVLEHELAGDRRVGERAGEGGQGVGLVFEPVGRGEESSVALRPSRPVVSACHV